MKTSTVLIIAGIAGLGYYLYKNMNFGSYSADIAPQYTPQTFTTVTPNDKGQSTTKTYNFSTVAEGVSQLNAAWNAGEKIIPVNKTLVKNVTAKVNGETLTGNIASLNGKKAFVAVKNKNETPSYNPKSTNLVSYKSNIITHGY